MGLRATFSGGNSNCIFNRCSEKCFDQGPHMNIHLHQRLMQIKNEVGKLKLNEMYAI